MAKHEVTCISCGRRFDVDKEGGQYLPGERRYKCKKCVNAEKAEARKRSKEAAAQNRERETGTRESKTSMIIKIVIGALFVAASFTLLAEGNLAAFFVGLAIGAGLIVWGGLPLYKMKNR